MLVIHIRNLDGIEMLLRKGKLKREQYWNNVLDEFNSIAGSIKNRRGRARGYEENRMVVLAINTSMRGAITANRNNNEQISWRKIEEEVAHDFHLRLNYLIELRKYFLDSGVVVVIDTGCR